MIDKDEVEEIEEDEIDELEYRETNVEFFYEDWVMFGIGIFIIAICVAVALYFGVQT